MLKKLLFFISLVVFLNQINLTFAEIIPLKKPIQTQEQKEQKLLIDVLKPLPKPITKKIIEKEKKQSYIKFKMMEENDDGTFSKWFKENYFDKDSNKSEEDVEDYFSLTKTDLEKFSSKKSKKKAK